MDDAKAVWTTAYINTLPDSAFLYIEAGGEKDDEGKTTPRSLRHFPYKDSSGSVDLPHLRNAIARIPQSNAPGLTPEKKQALQEKARRILAEEQKSIGEVATTAVKVLAQTDDTLHLGGYGVVFGGRDLDGETFTPDTDYMLDLVPDKLVLYDHRQGKVRHPLGRVARDAVRPDEHGLWVEAELNRHADYVDAVEMLVEKGALGWSSGSVGHLIDREGGVIKAWPIVEFSLTPTPAEPRTLGVDVIKSLAELDDAFGALLPEDGAPSAQGADAATNKATVADQEQQERDMDKEKEPTQEVGLVLDAVKQLSDGIAGLAGRMEKIEKEWNAPPTKAATIQVTDDEADKKAARPWKSFGEQLAAVARHAMSRGLDSDPRLKATKATGLSEGISSEGGFLVQTDFATELFRRTYDVGQVASRCRRIPVSANANGLTINAIDETSRAAGSRWGGIQAYWLAEAGTKSATKPKFRQMELKLRKLIGLCYATDELLADAMALESIIREGFAEEFAYQLDNSIVRGTGGGDPLGILNAACLVSVDKETGQAAATLVTDNILKMWSRCWGRSRANAVWLINQDIEPQLYSLDLPVGTGGMSVFMPPGGLSTAPYATLMGRPVIPVEYCSTLGTVGDIILGDFSQYLLIEKGGLESASSIHVQFTTDETAFRFVLRVDGQPGWNAALTPASGSGNTLSPFVALATRA